MEEYSEGNYLEGDKDGRGRRGKEKSRSRWEECKVSEVRSEYKISYGAKVKENIK